MSAHHFVVTLTCEDRPGIVAAVTTELAAAGANIAESNQFWDRTTNRFFLRIALMAPDGVDRAAIERALRPTSQRFAMKVSVSDSGCTPSSSRYPAYCPRTTSSGSMGSIDRKTLFFSSVIARGSSEVGASSP